MTHDEIARTIDAEVAEHDAKARVLRLALETRLGRLQDACGKIGHIWRARGALGLPVASCCVCDKPREPQRQREVTALNGAS